MYPDIDTRNPAAVEGEASAIYRSMFPQGDPEFIHRAFSWVQECFNGRHREYLPIDARYHDLEHTMQGTLCMVRLLQAREQAGAKPPLTQRIFELGLLAILFHDTGYLKKRGDADGTGAKYTLTHVARSVQFAEEFLDSHNVPIDDIRAVQHMIRCTGVNVNLGRIPFQNDLERIIGFCLGTADLLGQMAADDYVEKLPVLFAEFEESARFYAGKMSGITTFTNPEDLMRKTPEFWEKYVLPKLENDFWGLYRFLNRPYPAGPNPYVEHIQANITRLRQKLGEPVPA